MRIHFGKKKALRVVVVLCVLLAAFIAWFLIAEESYNDPAITGLPTETSYEIPVESIDGRIMQNDIILPAGKLIVSRLRAFYENESMRLVIPRLSLDTPVGGDTSQETLAKYPGLYKYSQIPNNYNTNVSIAGHRDLPQYDFYYLDTIVEGDYIYVVYFNKVFKYIYRSTEAVVKNNWDPIRVHYDNRITLTTCTPLGTARQRMIVVGELVEASDYSESYVFE